MYTELEAKEKWCPYSYMHRPSPTATLKCVGSKCMAWRWINCYEPVSFSGRPTTRKELPKEEWTGYCGLAGKP